PRRKEVSLPLDRFSSSCDLFTLIACSRNISSRRNAPAWGEAKGDPPEHDFPLFSSSMSACSTPNNFAKRFDRLEAAAGLKPLGSRLPGQRYAAKLVKPEAENAPSGPVA